MTSESASSQTALTAAAARAAHLIVDAPPVIFADSLAGTLLGSQAEELIGYHRSYGEHPVLTGARAQATCRSRYTEDALASAVAGGIAQYVILGAGLDSFAYRSELAGQVRVFEVDHPATQDRKRERLSAARIAIPENLTLVPADFERDSLAAALALAGADPSRTAFVSWLGVTMYLTTDAIAETLSVIGGLAKGTELVADFMLPAGMRDEAGDSYVEQVARVAAAGGEPWRTLLAPSGISALLSQHGLGVRRHVLQRDIGGPDLWARSDALRPVQLAVIAHAVVG
jgi:methyltransferase (TIGR00027 family)